MYKLLGSIEPGRSAEEGTFLPWHVACQVFHYHVLNQGIKQGKSINHVVALLKRGRDGDVVEELKELLDKAVAEYDGKPSIQMARRPNDPQTDYFTVELPAANFGRSKPTEAGGEMLPPGEAYRRVFTNGKLLEGLSEEETNDMELRATKATDYMMTRMQKARGRPEEKE